MEKKRKKRKTRRERVAIIGAGPVGCYCAEILAKKGFKVKVFEEHKKIGEPVQCTGIVTKEFFEVIEKRKEFIVNELEKVKVHAPNGTKAELKIKDYVIDRKIFDKYLMAKAKKEGARFYLGWKATEIKEEGKEKKVRLEKTGKKKRIKTIIADILIGADGPNSIVGKHLGNKTNKKGFWTGIQAIAKGKFDKDKYEVFFGKELPRFFGWIVPENERKARIGIAAEKNPKKVFRRFMKRLNKERKKVGEKKIEIEEMQGGLIPKYNPKTKIEKNNTFILGDAATQVKATTGGGLVPGLKASEALGRAIEKGTKYRTELKEVKKELKRHKKIRKVLNKFRDKDYDKLIKHLKKPRLKKIIEKGSRDQAGKLTCEILIKEPKMLLLAKVLLKKEKKE